jgi:hypothetical protein
VLPIAALVVPAGGIAYLGAVAYRNERGSAPTIRVPHSAPPAAELGGAAPNQADDEIWRLAAETDLRGARDALGEAGES